MHNYVILCDTCVDLDKKQREQYGVEQPIAGGIVFPNGEGKLADTDWEEMTFEEFFHSMEKKAVYKSSMPNPEQIKERVEAYFKEGKDVLSITLSSGMSGTFNSFCAAKKEMEDKYPGRKMEVIDSKRYSGGIALLAIYADKNRKEGMSLQDNYQFLLKTQRCVHQMGILDDLKFLARSGRISKFKAFMGGMVGVKPMADFENEKGYPVVLGKSRGYKSSYKNIVSYIKATIGDPKDKIFVISQSIREQQANELKQHIAEAFKDDNITIVMNRVGQSDGVNIGPGLVTAFYVGNEVSPNCEEERKILENILTAK